MARVALTFGGASLEANQRTQARSLENGFAVLVVLLFSIHLWALIAWQVFQQLFNMLGHLGYEVFPRWWRAAPLSGLKTASTHHNLHHERFRGNSGLYFVWRDRWMGTEFADDER